MQSSPGSVCAATSRESARSETVRQSSKERERVSILIRSSARPELADALASLAAQTYQNLQVVVVNVTGRSHPPLPDAAASLNIKFVDGGRQLPRPLVANEAIEAATGDYVAFLDDDDLFEPEHVERCLPDARAYPETVPFVGAQITDEKGELQACKAARADAARDSEAASGVLADKPVRHAPMICRSSSRQRSSW